MYDVEKGAPAARATTMAPPHRHTIATSPFEVTRIWGPEPIKPLKRPSPKNALAAL